MDSTKESVNKYAPVLGVIVGCYVAVAYAVSNARHEFPPFRKAFQILDGHGIEYSVTAVLLAMLTVYLIGRYRDHGCSKRFVGRKSAIVLIILSVLFGMINVSGENMHYLDSLMLGHDCFWTGVFFFCAIGYGIVFFEAALLLIITLETKAENTERVLDKADYRIWLGAFALIIVCWAVWIIAYYPATVDFDTEKQLCSYLGYSERSNHHPWFSTCFLGICYQIGKSFGNDNTGIFFYVAVRALIMALIYSRCVVYLKQEGAGRATIILITLYYAVTPVWGAYAKQPFKDSFCAALFCLYVLTIFMLVKRIQRNEVPKYSLIIWYSMTGLFVSFFRHNYFFVFAAITVLLIVAFAVKRFGEKKMAVLIGGVILYLGLNFCMIHCFDVKQTESKEALSIPFQQTARTVKYHEREIPKKEAEAIRQILPYEQLGEYYDPGISDPVKDKANQEATKRDYQEYLSVWNKQMWRHPKCYVEATIANSYGYYAFTSPLPKGGGKGNYGMVILDNINRDSKARFDVLFDFHYDKSLRKLRKDLRIFSDYWGNIPVINLTNSIPLYTWLIIFAFVCQVLRRNWLMTIPIFALMIAILTCMASPVNGTFRYFAPIAASTPLLLLLIGSKPKQEQLTPDGVNCDNC